MIRVVHMISKFSHDIIASLLSLKIMFAESFKYEPILIVGDMVYCLYEQIWIQSQAQLLQLQLTRLLHLGTTNCDKCRCWIMNNALPPCTKTLPCNDCHNTVLLISLIFQDVTIFCHFESLKYFV